jgi:nucleoside-diphosphate-sugar epimerase
MNMLTSLAAFAAICRHQGIPLRFPGSPGAWTALHQTTDAELLARAVDWALTADPARGEAFNVTNGDHFRWQHLWPDLAEHFSMPIAAPQPMSLTEQMSDKEEVWNSVVARHGLRRPLGRPSPPGRSWTAGSAPILTWCRAPSRFGRPASRPASTPTKASGAT